MAEKRPKQLSPKERAELYRQFLEDDAQSLRIIFRHAGKTLFLSAKPEQETRGQVVQLLTAVAETQRRFESPHDPVWHGDSLWIRGDTTKEN